MNIKFLILPILSLLTLAISASEDQKRECQRKCSTSMGSTYDVRLQCIEACLNRAKLEETEELPQDTLVIQKTDESQEQDNTPPTRPNTPVTSE